MIYFSRGWEEVFEVDFADMWARQFPPMLVGGQGIMSSVSRHRGAWDPIRVREIPSFLGPRVDIFKYSPTIIATNRLISFYPQQTTLQSYNFVRIFDYEVGRMIG